MNVEYGGKTAVAVWLDRRSRSKLHLAVLYLLLKATTTILSMMCIEREGLPYPVQ